MMASGIISGSIRAEEIKIDEGELKRRLGGETDSALSRFPELWREIFAKASPKYSARELALSVSDCEVSLGDIRIASTALARHLFEARSAYAVALTLGLELDRYIRRCSARSATLGFTADAIASALADGAAYAAVERIFAAVGHTAPFAIGYADTDLLSLDNLLSITDAKSILGISTSASHLMIPTKSIVVIVGKM